MVSIAPAPLIPSIVTWTEPSPRERVGSFGAESVTLHESDGRWTAHVGGSLLLRRDVEADLREVVERAAARAAAKPGRSLGSELSALARREGLATWAADVVAPLLAGGHVFAPGTEDCEPSRRVLIGLEAFARDLARRGWTFGPGGAVHESWRARAMGRWIVAPWFEDGTSYARLEAGVLLEVWPDESSVEGGWAVRVDGDVVAEIRGRKAAQDYAVRLAQARME